MSAFNTNSSKPFSDLVNQTKISVRQRIYNNPCEVKQIKAIARSPLQLLTRTSSVLSDVADVANLGSSSFEKADRSPFRGIPERQDKSIATNNPANN